MVLLGRLGEASWTRRSEHLLGGVGDVEEAVCVPVVVVNVSHAGGHARHALLRHQEEEGLGGVQINLAPDGQTRERGEPEGWTEMSLRPPPPPQTAANNLPEQTQELTQGELKGNQELCLVQQGEGLFTDVTFNNHLKTHNQPVIDQTPGFPFKTLM